MLSRYDLDALGYVFDIHRRWFGFELNSSFRRRVYGRMALYIDAERVLRRRVERL